MKQSHTIRAQVIRRDEEISDLRHEIESARDAANGENALRLEAERERDEALRLLLSDYISFHADRERMPLPKYRYESEERWEKVKHKFYTATASKL